MADVNVKTLQTRIALKYDSYSAWTTAPGKDLVLLPGELGICHISDANQGSNVVPTVLFKVGDGSKTFEQLPWASAKAADVYSWAKASEVKREGKKLVFVGGKIDGSNFEVEFDYVTLAEVQAITNGLASRIEVLEGKFTGENDVQGQIDALDGRLDVIEGSGEGSVAKALADAKAYTDEREVEIKKYADQAELDAISAAETASENKVKVERARIDAVEGRLDVIEGEGEGSVKKALEDAKSYADQAELDAVASAKSYTDDREAAIKLAYEAYADQAEADAKSYADDEIVKAVNSLNAKNESQDTEIGNKLDKSVYDAYIEGKSMSDEELKAYADGKASAAQSAAEATAAADAAAKVKALKEGEVAANAAAISAMDTAYKAADEVLEGRLDAVAAKLADVTNVMDFRGAVTELPDVAGYQNGDVIVITAGDNSGKEYVLSDGVWVEFGNTDANSTAISDLQGRMTTAEGDIDKLEAKDVELANADIALGQRIDALVGEDGAIAAGDAATLASAKGYTNEREAAIKLAYEAYADQAETDAVASAKSYTDGQISGLKSTLEAADEALEGNVQTLQDIVDGYQGKGSIKSAVDAKLASADFDSWKSAHENDHAESATEIAAAITAAVKTETDNRVEAVNAVDAKVGALDTRVGAAEGKITTLQGIVESGADSNANLRSAITDLQTLTGENGAIRSEIAAAKKSGDDAAQAVTDLTNGQVKTNKENIGKLDSRVEAIEGDYLKQADLFVINCGSATTVTHTA